MKRQDNILLQACWQWSMIPLAGVAINHAAGITTGWVQTVMLGTLGSIFAGCCVAYRAKRTRALITPFDRDGNPKTWDICRENPSNGPSYLKALGPVDIPSLCFSPLIHFFLPWQKKIGKIDPLTGGISVGTRPVSAVGKNDASCDPVYSNELITGPAAIYLSKVYEALRRKVDNYKKLSSTEQDQREIFKALYQFGVEIEIPEEQIEIPCHGHVLEAQPNKIAISTSDLARSLESLSAEVTNLCKAIKVKQELPDFEKSLMIEGMLNTLRKELGPIVKLGEEKIDIESVQSLTGGK